MKRPRAADLLLCAGLALPLVATGGPRAVNAQAGPARQPWGASGAVTARSNAIALHGGHLYLAAGRELVIAAVTGPGVLLEIARTPALPAPIEDVAVTDGVAYVAAGAAGVRVYDVSVPALPRQIGQYGTHTPARGLAVDGPYAYVAVERDGLLILDVSRRGAPVEAGALETEDARDVFLHWPIAFVADGEGGLLVVDVSAPALPVRLGWLSMPGDALGVHVVWPHAHVAAASAGLRIVDVSNPLAPRETGAYDGTYARGVHVAGDRAYLASDRNGLWVIDVADPRAPAALGSFAGAGSIGAVITAGHFAYAASAARASQAVVVDISPFGRAR